MTLIRTYWYQNHIANQDAGPNIDVSKLDWKRFLGTASDRPFDADQYAHWRWYWDFGGGAMTDLFIHWVDVAQWYHERRYADARYGNRREGAAAAAADAGHHERRAPVCARRSWSSIARCSGTSKAAA